MPNAKKYTELMVVTDNERGSFTRIATPLRDNKINIVGFCAYEWGNEAAFRIITNNNAEAQKVLGRQGWTVFVNPVVLWEASNRPGSMEKATNALLNSNVNIYSTYTTTKSNGRKAVVAFTTSDTETAFNVLSRI